MSDIFEVFFKEEKSMKTSAAEIIRAQVYRVFI